MEHLLKHRYYLTIQYPTSEEDAGRGEMEFFEREDIVRALGKLLIGLCGKHFRRFKNSRLYAVVR